MTSSAQLAAMALPARKGPSMLSRSAEAEQAAVLGVRLGATAEELDDAFLRHATQAVLERDGSVSGSLREAAAAFEALAHRQLRRSAPGDAPGAASAGAAPPKPGLSAERQRVATVARPLQGSRDLGQLHKLLGRLGPDQRRKVITKQLTEAQRLALERWMLLRAAAGRGRGEGGASAPAAAPAAAAHVWRCAKAGSYGDAFYACVHLGRGLHAQSARCRDPASAAAALAGLLRLRARCRLAEAARAQDGLHSEHFARGVEEAVGSVTAGLGGDGRGAARAWYFRTLVSFGRGIRLSTPMRADPRAALKDWWRLGGGHGEALLSGAHLRRGITPEAAAARWSEACAAWLDLWSKRGSQHRHLEARLASMEAVWKPRLSRATRHWRQSQAALSQQLSRLVERQARHAQLRRSLAPAAKRKHAACGEHEPRKAARRLCTGGALAAPCTATAPFRDQAAARYVEVAA